MSRIPVAILGATGSVGQRFVQLLADHPWFEVAELYASERNSSRRYAEAARWVLDGDIPADAARLRLKPLTEKPFSQLVFSALPKEAAILWEADLAAAGHFVCSNASTHRMDDDVPLLLPLANPDHLQLLETQQRNRNWSGGIITNSNCTATPVVMCLAPLLEMGIEQIHIVSAQAISGAGHPGVASLDILDNIIPYIADEEEKLALEPLKMLGTRHGELIHPLAASVSATCLRVPVLDGHLVNLAVKTREPFALGKIITAWEDHSPSAEICTLPSAPARALQYLRAADRPQPRRDRNAGAGMTTSIGRLRTCPNYGFQFAALSHNTILGAAGCSILNAELLFTRGMLQSQVSQAAEWVLPA